MLDMSYFLMLAGIACVGMDDEETLELIDGIDDFAISIDDLSTDATIASPHADAEMLRLAYIAQTTEQTPKLTES